MFSYHYQIELGGIALQVNTRNRIDILEHLRTDTVLSEQASVPDEFYTARVVRGVDVSPAAAENNLLPYAVSNAILPTKRCIFHGVAFMWRGKAWIFTAPPGTGKTTQYALWKAKFGDEIRLLNGDKPLLECTQNGQIWVHPSPWRGKECMSREESAPLGGLILLEQSSKNHIQQLSVREAVEPVFRQFLFAPDNAETVQAVCQMEEELLRLVPVWALNNRGDTASAILAHDTILQWEDSLR